MVHGLRAGPRTTWFVVVLLVLGLGAAYALRYRTGRWRRLRVVDAEPVPMHEETEVPF
jgi:hypothetical protein